MASSGRLGAPSVLLGDERLGLGGSASLRYIAPGQGVLAGSPVAGAWWAPGPGVQACVSQVPPEQRHATDGTMQDIAG